MKEHADNSGNHADLWPFKICLTTRSNGYSFLLITQYEMPFINKREATKMPKDRKINGKCTNGTNCWSCVWPVCFIYIRNERKDLERTSSKKRKRKADILRSRCLLSDYPQVILQSVPSKTLLLSDLVQCFFLKTGTQRSQLRFYPSEFPPRELVLEISGFFQNHFEVLLADLLVTPVYALL